MTWSVTTPPNAEPVELSEVKLHLRVDDGSEDALITAFIRAAREYVESVCERALMPQEWTEKREGFPPALELRGGVVTAIISVNYVDVDGDQQTLPNSAYSVDITAEPAIIRPAFGASWPATRREPGAVSVKYSVGYKDAESVPATLRAAIYMIVAGLYANREATIDQRLVENRAVSRLLWPYKRVVP